MSQYGFTDYLSADFPSQINVDVTEFCNLECVHCPFVQASKAKGRSRVQIDEALHRKLIDDIAANSGGACRYIRYTGEGEPLLHKKLVGMLAYAREKTDMQITLTTNGTLLDEKRGKAVIAAGVDIVDVSIDAYNPSTFAKVRVKGELEPVQRNVKTLIQLSKDSGGNTKVMVSFVEQELNRFESEPFKQYWEAAGADFVVLRRQHSCAGNMEPIKEAMWAVAPTPRKPCLYPWERLVVSPTGSYSYCPADWYHQANIGNVSEQSIKEVWQGEKMRALRQAHLDNDFSGHGFCGQCPDWMAIRWPWEGRSYATVVHEFAEQKHTASGGGTLPPGL